MARPVSIVDAAVIRKADDLHTDVRNVMLFTRALRSGMYEITSESVKVIEDFLFVLTGNHAELADRVRTRLAEYGELADAMREATIILEQDQPMIRLANTIVCLGSYRPRAANDCDFAGGAA